MRPWILPITAAVIILAVVWWHVTETAALRLQSMRKQVVIEQVANGYTIDLCVQQHPCPTTRHDRRIAKDPQGAAAEAFAYLSGKKIRPDWSEE